jgi:hypothetical protein
MRGGNLGLRRGALPIEPGLSPASEVLQRLRLCNVGRLPGRIRTGCVRGIRR